MMVAFSHAGVAWHGYHLGVPAVVVFFILSGFVVASLLDSKPTTFANIKYFYQERLYRLLPLYAFFVLLGAVCAPGWLQGLSWGQKAYVIFSHLTIAPLNYQMLTPWLSAHMATPPAWSLGLELQFYCIAPFICRTQSRVLLVFFLSWLLYMWASLVLMAPYTDWFGYRFLPGNIFMFLAGVLLYRIRQGVASRLVRTALGVSWGGGLMVLMVNSALGRSGTPFVDETAAGYLLGLPLVAGLSCLSRKRGDEWLGNLANKESVTPITGPNSVPKNINGKLFFSLVKMGLLFDFSLPAKSDTINAAEKALRLMQDYFEQKNK
jgi:peptidoglycan/LPS O-acetylase OafA/YrhL